MMSTSALPREIRYAALSLQYHRVQEIAELIHLSAPELFDLMFGRKGLAILADLVVRSHNSLSYQYIRVAECAGTIVGIAIALPASALKDQEDYRTVLSLWGQFRCQMLKVLLLDRVLRHDYPDDTIYIANLAVHPDYQRQGIGTALLHQCLSDARAKAATAVYISVDVANPNAERLYLSQGFRVVETKTIQVFKMTVGSRVLMTTLH